MSMVAPQIPGLELFEELGRGARNVVYRGRRRGRLVAVKIPRDPASASQADYCREAALQARVPGAGMPEVYEVGHHDGIPFLISEFVDGVSLANKLRQGPLEAAAVMRLVSDLSHSLQAIHENGLVHRDLKPANILLTSSGQARLIDFGLATRSHLGQSSQVTGTFRYSAPEQTGMLARPLDGRADLYALGVVLFECLSGHPPFSSEDPAELIRLHAVGTPPNLEGLTPHAPQPLIQAIHRLLCKDPDDRFESAAELLLALGLPGQAHPSSARACAGHHRQLEALQAHWREVQSGPGRLLLLQGETGSGKSFIAAEFARRCQQGGAVVLQAHCQPSMHPFGLLHDGLQRNLALAPPETAAAVAQAAGVQAGWLAQLSPALARLLPASAPPPEEEGHLSRYPQIVTDFLLQLAGELPLVVVLDDLHWLDPSSLQILRRLVEALPRTHLLLVGTSRQPLPVAPQETLILEPLLCEDIEQMLTNVLGGAAEPGVAERVLKASGGLPLACFETIHAALDAGLFVPHWGSWRLEGEGLAQLDLPGDVMATVLRRLEPLSDPQRQILQQAALLGLSFEADLLTRLVPSQATQVYAVAAEAVRLNLLERRESGHYRFVHDRVREALLAGLSALEQCTLHRQVARALDADQVFERAEHLWLASAGNVCEETGQACRLAGLQALKQHAYDESYEYFRRAAQSSPADQGHDADHEEAFAEAAYRTGHCPESLLHLQRAVTLTDIPHRRARLFEQMAMVHMVELDTDQAWPAVVAGLQCLGIQLGSNPRLCLQHALGNAVGLALSWFKPVGTRARCETTLAAVRLYRIALQICVFDVRLAPMVEVTLRGLRAARRLGASPELASFYSFFSVLLASARRNSASATFASWARQVASQLQDPTVVAQLEMHRAQTVRLQGDDLRASRMGEECLRRHGAWLNPSDFLMGVLDVTHNLHFRGHLAAATQWAELGAQRVRSQQFPMVVTCSLSAVYSATGRLAEARKQAEICRSLFEGSRSVVLRSAYLASSIHTHLETGELGNETDRLVQEYHSLGFKPWLGPVQMRSVYIMEGYIRMRQCQADSTRLGQFAQALKQLRGCGNAPLFRAHRSVLEAAYQRMLGHFGRAQHLLHQAESLSHRNDNVWVRVEVSRQRALILRAQGLPEAATREANLAAFLAREAGWTSQVYLLEREFCLDPRATTVGSRESATHSAQVVRLQRNLEALLQVTLSPALLLDSPRLCQVALQELVRILGAERGFLFLQDQQQLRFEAGTDSHGAPLGEPTDHASSLVKRVADQGQTLLMSSTEEGQSLGSESVVAHDLRSILAAPLLLGERLLGVIYLDSRLARGVFGQDDLQLLHALANQMAVTLETARVGRLEVQVRAEREQRVLAEQLGDLVGVMLSHLDTQSILERLLEGLAQVISHQASAVFLSSPEGSPWAVERGSPSLQPHDDSLPWQQVLAGTRPLQGLTPVAWIATPLRSHQGPLGVLCLERPPEQPFERRELEVIHTFAGYASLALENARLFSDVERLATTDELTGLSNRRHFFRQGEDEFRRADRLGHEVSVLMFDIDHFKKFNDNYGHAIGDVVLSTAAGRCRRALRSIDILGRYGGEEFAVLLVGTALEPGAQTAERLRACMADQLFDSPQGALQVTISLGLAERLPGESLEAALERADQALYRAKEAGRNRVECATAPEITRPADSSR